VTGAVVVGPKEVKKRFWFQFHGSSENEMLKPTEKVIECESRQDILI